MLDIFTVKWSDGCGCQIWHLFEIASVDLTETRAREMLLCFVIFYIIKVIDNKKLPWEIFSQRNLLDL